MGSKACPQAGGIPELASLLSPLFQCAQRPWVTLARPCPRCPRPHPPPTSPAGRWGHCVLPPRLGGLPALPAQGGQGKVAVGWWPCPPAMAVPKDAWPGARVCGEDPQTPSLLSREETGAFVVPKKQRWAGHMCPQCKLCPQRCHQAGPTGVCSDPCPTKPALVPLSQPGGRCRGVLQAPGTAIGWRYQDGLAGMTVPGLTSPGWRHKHGLARIVAPGLASLKWHWDGRTGIASLGWWHQEWLCQAGTGMTSPR